MTEFRGRYFSFLTLLCVTWVAARIGFIAVEPNPTFPVPQRSKPQPQIAPHDVVSLSRFALPRAAAAAPFFGCCGSQPLTERGQALASRNATLSFRNPYNAPASAPSAAEPGAARADSTLSRGKRIVLSQPVQPLSPRNKAQFYVYSFWRDGGQAGALNGGTQYGGSQSGFVASYALGHFATKGREEKLALLLRGAIAYDNLREREIAAGLRWRPSQRIPLSLIAERRFRNGRSDAFAAYLAGGVSEVSLPMQFRLEAFGQAGVVSGRNAGAFFDFLARADRKVADIGTARISAGAGAWGGGQDSVRRVDIGPSVRTDVTLGEANIRLSTDWRFRVAGNASPTSGPAVTLSTSF